ncbi:ExeM/NucH family extracellular endonuclease [Elongatibacter sediminis]|uniref:ExeM/NucH family extracellular endonuclease n=1 Tax=Elongatibacter sediminis TaxID=3119006 RepID=A0AAW9RAM2_9GAMM
MTAARSHGIVGWQVALLVALVVLLAGAAVFLIVNPDSGATGTGVRTTDRSASPDGSVQALQSMGACGDPATLISAVQGDGPVSPMAGEPVVIEAVVVGDYQETRETRPSRPELQGFFVQEEDADADGSPSTSEGLFVFDPGKRRELTEGDLVRVLGTVAEFAGNTQLADVRAMARCEPAGPVTPAVIHLPVAPDFATRDAYFERFEGMWVRFDQPLTVTGQGDLARYGQLRLSQGGRLRHYGQDGALPLSREGFARTSDEQARRSLLLDDFNTQQNIDPVWHPQPGGFAVDNAIRTGATVHRLSGVLNFSFGQWTVQPRRSEAVIFDNPRRPAPPQRSGDVMVAVLNVLNYFNGDGRGGGFPTARGAHSEAELQRQTDKLVAAIVALDADVLGLLELENDGNAENDALPALTAAVNAALGAQTYAFIPAGRSGGEDEIKVGMMFKPGVVGPSGPSRVFAEPAFTDPNATGEQRNRPALVQTFTPGPSSGTAGRESFTVVLLHLKSKGSLCGPGDDSDIQGNCNGTRTRAIEVLVDWMDTNSLSAGDSAARAERNILVIGDFNSYYREDPLQVLRRAGYVDVLDSSAHSFVYRGVAGALDHALASPQLASRLAGGGVWHINADENRLLDYNDTVRDSGEKAHEVRPGSRPLYAPDPYRSSDHDPVWVGLYFSDP